MSRWMRARPFESIGQSPPRRPGLRDIYWQSVHYPAQSSGHGTRRGHIESIPSVDRPAVVQADGKYYPNSRMLKITRRMIIHPR